jgi:hypothetical protein
MVNTLRRDSWFSTTNTSPDQVGYVHLFFVDWSNCSEADKFITLTQKQTVSFYARDLDPLETAGLVAEWGVGDHYPGRSAEFLINREMVVIK